MATETLVNVLKIMVYFFYFLKKVPLYENLDAIHMASPKVRQPRTSPTNDDVKEVLNLERFAQASK